MKPNQRIDKLLGELGLPPHAVDPEELHAELDPISSAPHTPITGLCGKTCYPSETRGRKCANLIKKRGANTSFLRPYYVSVPKSTPYPCAADRASLPGCPNHTPIHRVT